jgi:hypothetical protein
MIPAVDDKLPVVGGLPARRLDLRVAFALLVRGLVFAAATRAEDSFAMLWVTKDRRGLGGRRYYSLTVLAALERLYVSYICLIDAQQDVVSRASVPDAV